MSANSDRETAGDAASTVLCPYCQEPQQVEVVSCIHHDDNELLEQLFHGTINRADCRKCGRMFALNFPVVFRDDPRHYLVYFLPLDDPSRWNEAEEQMQELTATIFTEEQIEPPVCRLTISRASFIEKVALHLADLDDRLVEYIKYQLYNRGEQSIDPVRQELFYDFTNSDADKLAFVVFDRETATAVASAHIPRDVYDELNATFFSSSGLRKELDALFPGCYISVERLFFDEP